MALDSRYFVTSDVDTYFVDKDSGLPLAAGTLTFFRDIARTEPKAVYQLTGAPPAYTYTALPNPITLSAVGTVQNAGGDNEVIYYFPFDENGDLDLYYVVGRDEDGVEQFTREAWPNITEANNPSNTAFPIQNQIANPQFTKILINLDRSTTYTVMAATNQVFEFAPDWDFVISGSGDVTVEIIDIDGDENVITSPPYVLDVTTGSGITSCFMRQRMAVNSGLWASTDTASTTQDIFLSGYFVARNEGAGSASIKMFYNESSGGSPVTIVDAAVTGGTYEDYKGATALPIPASTNTDTGADGYVDIYLSFAGGIHVRVTSIQVVPNISQAGGTLFSYDMNSSNREQALMGDYYIPRLNEQLVPSKLVGWDFSLNPRQLGSSGSITTTTAYILDQTIAQKGSTGTVTWGGDAATDGLQFTTGGTDSAFYIMQYLRGSTIADIIGSRLSVNIDGFKTSTGNDVTVRVYLFRAPTASVFPTLPTSIGTIANTGVFSVTAAGWTEISRSGLGTATGTLPIIATSADLVNDNSLKFTGWEITDSTQLSDTDKIAIVVTFGYPSASTVITARSISLNVGDLPTKPSPQTYDEVYRECCYYYETSYGPTIAAATVTSTGEQIQSMGKDSGGGNISVHARAFNLIFKTLKLGNPTITFYSPTSATPGLAFARYQQGVTQLIATTFTFASFFTLNVSSQNSTNYTATNTTSSIASAGGVIQDSDDSQIFYHYVADARIGVISL